MKSTTIMFTLLIAAASAQQAPSRSQVFVSKERPTAPVNPEHAAMARNAEVVAKGNAEVARSLEGAGRSLGTLFQRVQAKAQPLVDEAKKQADAAGKAASAQIEKEIPSIVDAKTALDEAQAKAAVTVLEAAKRVADETMK